MINLQSPYCYNINVKLFYILCQRPYHIEHTSSRPITEVKQCWARLVLGWVTAWEHWVLLAKIPFARKLFKTWIRLNYLLWLCMYWIRILLYDAVSHNPKGANEYTNGMDSVSLFCAMLQMHWYHKNKATPLKVHCLLPYLTYFFNCSFVIIFEHWQSEKVVIQLAKG